MDKIILTGFILVCLLAPVFAEQVIVLQYDIPIYGNATLERIDIKEGSEFFPNESGDYTIELIGENGSVLFGRDFEVGFFNSNELDAEGTILYLRAPWDSDTKKIHLKREGLVINEFSLSSEIINNGYKSEKTLGLLAEMEASEQKFENNNSFIAQSTKIITDNILIVVGIIIVIILLIIIFPAKWSKERG